LGKEIYSIRELIAKDSKFCEDKIFENLNQEASEKSFKYFHLKVKKVKERENKSDYLGVK
jgi:hypothetical protein